MKKENLFFLTGPQLEVITSIICEPKPNQKAFKEVWKKTLLKFGLFAGKTITRMPKVVKTEENGIWFKP